MPSLLQCLIANAWCGAAATGLGLLLFAASGGAQVNCRALVPEVAADLADGQELPTSASRWRAVERLWLESAIVTLSDVDNMMATGSLSPAADVITGLTHELLRAAINQDQAALTEALLGLWQKPLEKLTMRSEVAAPYQVSKVPLERAQEMWTGADGTETVLYSAIYLAGATDILAAIAEKPASARSAQMTDFARRIGGLAQDHYVRWAFGPPNIWQVRGWGCDTRVFDLTEFTQLRLDRSLGKGKASYCAAPTSGDLLLAVGITSLLHASAIAPDLVMLSDFERQRLTALVKLQAKFTASRLVYDTAVDRQGRSVTTVDFDPGAWSSYPDFAYAADEALQFPEQPVPPKPGVGWDFSHAYRIAWAMLTFASNPHIVGIDVDWSGASDAFARQIAIRVLESDADGLPRFRNYLDGSNGWYRVNYSNRQGSGYPPYAMSRAFFTAPWARLSARDPDLLGASAALWKYISTSSQAQCDHFRQVYIEGSYWHDRRPVTMPLSGHRGNMNLMPFLAVAPVR
jgi:hypothetical protein